MRLKAFILALLVSFTAFAQTEQQQLPFSVSGSVVDAQDGHALQYVNVTIPGLNFATVTNTDGAFIIKSSTQPSSVEFNLLGYKSVRIPAPADGSPIIVKMQRNVLTLNEAKVIAGDPYVVLDEAIRRIKVNYSDKVETFDCFYRETIQKRNRFIYISEAVSRMVKNPYTRFSAEWDRVAVDKSRVLASTNKKDTLSVVVVGGPTQAVDLDIVKNDMLLTRQEIANYNLGMDVPTMIGDRMQYAIRLTPAVVTGYPLYEGVIYIDRETFAFTRFDLSLDMRDKDKVTNAILIRKPAGLRFTPTEVNLRYDYTLSEGVSRVSYVRTTMKFKCDWKKRLLRSDFTAVSELVTTDRRSGDVAPITKKEAFGRHDALFEKATYNFDPEFWKDYNIIEPTESLDRAIGRIKKQTERN